MTEKEFQAGLDRLRDDWGSLSVDPNRPGMLVAANDPTTGLLVGFRASVIAEIINRALRQLSEDEERAHNGGYTVAEEQGAGRTEQCGVTQSTS